MFDVGVSHICVVPAASHVQIICSSTKDGFLFGGDRHFSLTDPKTFWFAKIRPLNSGWRSISGICI